MEKSCKKCATKAGPKPLFYFDITQKNHYMQKNSFKNKIWKTLSKSPKDVNFTFS